MSVTFSISTSIAQFYLILRGMMVATMMMMTMMMTVGGGEDGEIALENSFTSQTSSTMATTTTRGGAIMLALRAVICLVEWMEAMEEMERVVQYYWRLNCLVSFKTAAAPARFMGRKERKVVPNKIQTKYTDLDIPPYIKELNVKRELFEFVQKINNGREAVRKLVW